LFGIDQKDINHSQGEKIYFLHTEKEVFVWSGNGSHKKNISCQIGEGKKINFVEKIF